MGANNLKKNPDIRPNKKKNYEYTDEASQKLKVLLSNPEVAKIVQNMAQKIVNDFMDKEVGFVCVDDGAKPFYDLLIENIRALGLTDYYIGNVKVTTDATKNSGELKESRIEYEGGILLDKYKLQSVHLVFVDDQINKGRTWKKLKDEYKQALSIDLASLVIRPEAKKMLNNNEIRYPGFVFGTSKKRIVGYGMDHLEMLRRRNNINYTKEPKWKN